MHVLYIFDTDQVQRQSTGCANNILCGIQRVLVLLLLNPTRALSQLSVEEYSVLDCEPLHDLKGYFRNVLQELPFLIKGDKRVACESIIKAVTGDTIL